MAPTAVGDKINVLAKFEGGKLSPILMRWRGRRHWIKSLNLHHVEKRGDDKVHYFAVTTDIGDLTLSYSQQQLGWRLVETDLA